MVAAGALIIAAPSAFAGTDSVRFDFGQNGTWTVPARVTGIEVEVAGGGGGAGREAGGLGALVQADVTVAAGTTFTIGVGGGGGRNSHAGGGGGASIVYSDDVLLIAGGGGGGSSSSARAGGNAAHNPINGAGQSGGGGTGAFGGGDRGREGIGGSGGTARRPAGQNYDVVTHTGGGGGEGATVGGAGGDGRSSGGGGGGAGYGGGQAGGDLGGGGAGGSTAQGTGVRMLDGATSFYSQAGGAAGVRTFSGNPSTAGGDGWVVIRWLIPDPLPEPDVDPSTTPDAPGEQVVLQLAMPAGVICAAPTTDPSRTWIQLPSADECHEVNSPRSTPPINLLGWATTPDFPVAIAQRQIDNGWGAYEIFGSDGRIAAVFIPEGGWTQASSNTSLFPIWG